MAEFKTAEQYVVDRLVMMENELDNAKIEHSMEVEKLAMELDKTKARLDDALTLINIFRDFLDVRKDSYWGNCIFIEPIYGKEHPEEVELLMEYFDMYPEEDRNDA